MFSTGSHTRKMNGKLIKHDNYKLSVNPNNKGLVKLYTKQKDGNAYNNEFNNQEEFMKNFLANEKSLFKMNKNIGQQTKKRKPKKQKPKKQKPNSYYKTLFIKLQKKQKQQQKKQKQQQKKQKQQTEKIKRQFKYLQRSLS